MGKWVPLGYFVGVFNKFDIEKYRLVELSWIDLVNIIVRVRKLMDSKI